MGSRGRRRNKQKYSKKKDMATESSDIKSHRFAGHSGEPTLAALVRGSAVAGEGGDRSRFWTY
jgi:hypothetical protein